MNSYTIAKIIDSSTIMQDAIKYVLEHSTSLHLPYHNFYHNLVVMEHCFNNFTYDMILLDSTETRQLTKLLMAAIFHDFSHSGGKLTDHENVKIAKQGFIDFNKSTAGNVVPINDTVGYLQIEYFSENEVEEICAIIDATEYSYAIPEKDLNACQLIIRECDLLQLFEQNRIQQIYLGLMKELNVKSFGDMIAGEMKFIASAYKFKTEYAQKIFSENINDVNNELEILNQIFNK